MKKRIILLLSLCCTLMVHAQVSRTIAVSAGNLYSSLSYTDRRNITDLTITGTLDARDFKTIRDEMPKLQSLNIGETTIEAYNGTEGTGYTSDYPANTLPDCAFYDEMNPDKYPLLTECILPASLTAIGISAFLNCYQLQSLVIPPSVETIGEFCFYGCMGLTNISIPPSVKAIGQSAFYECMGLTTITLPPSLTKIEDNTFSQCNGLLLLTLPSSVTEIGMHAFYACTGLTTITIPPSVTSLGRCAFSDCTGLTSIIIPPSVTSLGESTFSGCKNLVSVDLSATVTAIGKQVFSACDALTSINIPPSVTSIGDFAFWSCKRLPSITIPASVTTIGEYAFDRCYDLDSVFIPSSVTSIGVIAFRHSRVTVDDHNPVYSSKEGILYNKDKTKLIACPSLVTGDFIIPPSVTTISKMAFSLCDGIPSITIPPTVTTIESNAFYDYKGLVVIDEGNRYFSMVDGLLFNKTQTVLYQCPTTKTGTLVLPSTLDSIAGRAFYYCQQLTSITIPKTVTYIGAEAFISCNGLTAIDLPPNLTTIEDGLLSWCDGITNIVIPASVTSIGKRAFFNCSLHSIIIPDAVTSIGYAAFESNKLTSLLIPNSVTLIDTLAFCFNEMLSTVTLPASLTNIQPGAFYGCTGLETIYNHRVDPLPIDYYTFLGVDFYNCKLYVPNTAIKNYANAAYWRNFRNIAELPVVLSDLSALTIGPVKNSNIALWISSNTIWTAASNQPWLTIGSGTISGNGTLQLIASSNPTPSPRVATVTISGTGAASITITITQLAGTGVGIASTPDPGPGFYPNPANAMVTVTRLEGNATLQLADLTGKIVLTQTVGPHANINIAHLPVGCYLLKITTPNGTIVKRLLKE